MTQGNLHEGGAFEIGGEELVLVSVAQLGYVIRLHCPHHENCENTRTFRSQQSYRGRLDCRRRKASQSSTVARPWRRRGVVGSRRIHKRGLGPPLQELRRGEADTEDRSNGLMASAQVDQMAALQVSVRGTEYRVPSNSEFTAWDEGNRYVSLHKLDRFGLNIWHCIACTSLIPLSLHAMILTHNFIIMARRLKGIEGARASVQCSMFNGIGIMSLDGEQLLSSHLNTSCINLTLLLISAIVDVLNSSSCQVLRAKGTASGKVHKSLHNICRGRIEGNQLHLLFHSLRIQGRRRSMEVASL